MKWRTPQILESNDAYRMARRIVVAVVGFTVLLVGIVLIVMPGPAIVVIPAGLGILALEFEFARRWLHKFRRKASDTMRNHRLGKR